MCVSSFRKRRWSCITSSQSRSSWTETREPSHQQRAAAAEDGQGALLITLHPLWPCSSFFLFPCLSVSLVSSLSFPFALNVITGLHRAVRLSLLEYTLYKLHSCARTHHTHAAVLNRLYTKPKEIIMKKVFWCTSVFRPSIVALLTCHLS